MSTLSLHINAGQITFVSWFLPPLGFQDQTKVIALHSTYFYPWAILPAWSWLLLWLDLDSPRERTSGRLWGHFQKRLTEGEELPSEWVAQHRESKERRMSPACLISPQIQKAVVCSPLLRSPGWASAFSSDSQGVRGYNHSLAYPCFRLSMASQSPPHPHPRALAAEKELSTWVTKYKRTGSVTFLWLW